MRIDQLVPAFHKGDAIGSEALFLRDAFRKNGFKSDIYCIDADPGLEEEAKDYKEWDRASDISILHYAVPSLLNQVLKESKGQKVIIYHNITPHEFFLPFDKKMVWICYEGRRQLIELLPYLDFVIADSPFNEEEIKGLGFEKTGVLPLFVDWRRYEISDKYLTKEVFMDEIPSILFVGRVVPNKKIDDLLRVVAYYKRFISPFIRLLIVGKVFACPPYFDSLIKLMAKLEITKDEVVFLDHIPDNELSEIYRVSKVFLSLSEHEGFFLPAIECMYFDLPVIAYGSSAIPFTLGDSGIILREKRIDFVAELVHKVIYDESLRRTIISSQRERLEYFKKLEYINILLNYLGLK
ncbi:MAG: glycosyltransferase family 4 protein [Candidatus Aminicenantia bacterium]